MRFPERTAGPSARPRLAPEPRARPRGGNARSPAAPAGRGLGGAGEDCRRREFEESYRQREWKEPAVSMATCWPIAAAKAVYRGGASPWQQEKPFERLLNAGPAAAGAQRGAVGRGGDEGRWRGPRAGGRERQGWEELLPEPSFGLGCALSQVRDGQGCGPRKRRGVGTVSLSHPSSTVVLGLRTDI